MEEVLGTGVFDFDVWVQKFRDKGFEVETFADDGVCSAVIKGKGIVGAFSELGAWYKNLNGRFAADNADSFDKWSTAPLVMKMPLDIEVLEGHLKRLATKEGYKSSNTFAYFEDGLWPREIED